MEHVNNRSEDRETRAVLALASTPDIPGAAMDRLMARIAAEPQAAKVVAFTTRPARKAGFWRFATAVPLAASLSLMLPSLANALPPSASMTPMENDPGIEGKRFLS